MPVSYISPRITADDDYGRPIVGGQLYTYVNRTTIPKPTYRDAAGTAANTNPVILDANGSAVLYLIGNEMYTFVLLDADGVLLWSQDDILGQLDLDDLDEAVAEATAEAKGYAEAAAASAQEAKDAADAATLASGVYPDTNTIINGGDGYPPVPEGHFATTPSQYTGGFLDLYQVVSGAAVLRGTYPNREAVLAAITAFTTYTTELAEQGAGLVVAESPDDVEWFVGHPTNEVGTTGTGRMVGAVGVSKTTGDLVARFPVNDDRIKANVDNRLRDPFAQWVLCHGVDPLISVHEVDSMGRAQKWTDYRDGTKGEYFQGKKVDGGGGVGGTYSIVNDNGQSNSVGQSGPEREVVYGETYPYPDRLLMLGSAANNIWLGTPGTSSASRQITNATLTGLVPLRSVIASTNTHATTCAEGYLYALAQESQPFADYDGYVVWNTTEGNQSIYNMLNDAPAGNFYFQNQVFCTQKTVDYLAERGARASYDWMWMAQGEANTSLANLGALQNLLRSQLHSAVRPITQQTGPLRMLSFQMSSFQSVHAGPLSILNEALAQPEAWPVFLCAGPTYIFPFSTSDYLHNVSRAGHAARGEYCRAIRNAFYQSGGTYRPLHALPYSVTGANEITVPLSEPAVIDETWRVAAVENAGVTLDGGTVSSVSISGATLTITTAGAASEVTAVNFALVGQSSPRTQARIPRSTIRSVASLGQWSAATGGGQMYKPMCHQTIQIAA